MPTRQKVFKVLLIVVLLAVNVIASEIDGSNKNSFFRLNTDWQTMETDNFIIYYPNGYEWEANQALQNLEFYRDDVIELTGNNLSKIPIVIEDDGMYANAFAYSWENKIHIFTFVPNSKSSIGLDQNWYRGAAVHELTHIGHLTSVKGIAKGVKFVLGDIFLPNCVSPAWVIEGITVFSESQQSPYEGRINDGYFGAVIASKASEEKLPSITDATNIIPTYPFGDWYLNGGMFFDYLSNNYGEEKFSELFNRYGSYWWTPLVGHTFPWLGLDLASKKVYRKSMKKLYNEWTDFEEERYQNWKIDGEKLTNSGWYKSFLKESKNKIYYFRRYYNRIDIWFTQLVEFDPVNNEEVIITNLNNSITSPIQIQNNKIFYTISEIDRGYSNISTWGHTSILYSVDINTGKSNEIVKDDIRTFCILENGDVLYSKDQKHNFGSELWKYSNGEKYKLGVTNELISELECSNAGVFVVSKTDFENWNVNKFDHENMTFSPIADSPWAEFDIHLHEDKLFYTANHNSIYSVFAYDLTENTSYKLTNDGFAKEGIAIGDSLYFVGLSSKGEDLFVKPLIFTEWESPTWIVSTAPDFQSLNLSPKKGGYSSNLRQLFIPFAHYFYPNYEYERIGINVFGSDILGQNTITLGLEYSPEEKKYYYATRFGSKIFSPFYLSLYSNYSDYLRISSAYPLYKSLKPGLSYIGTDISAILSDEDFNVKTMQPSVTVSCRYPLTSFGISVSLPMQRIMWNSKEDKFGLNFNNWISHKTRFGYLELEDKFRYSDTDILEFKNRGEGELFSSSGLTVSPSYSVQLFKFRSGFWNLNAFIEDFNGKLFVDYTVVKNMDYLLAAGGELSVETRSLFGALRLSPTVGATINKEGKWNYYWVLNFPVTY